MSDAEEKGSSKKIIVWSTATVLTVGFLFVGGIAALGASYSNKILPSLFIGDIPVGGTSEVEVQNLIDSLFNKVVKEGVQVSFNAGNGNEEAVVPIPATIDVGAEAKAIVNYGKNTNVFTRGWRVATLMLSHGQVHLRTVSITDETVTTAIKSVLGKYEHPAVNASIKVTSVNPPSFTITSSTPGAVFDYQGLGAKVTSAWQEFQPARVQLASQIDQPKITEAQVSQIAPQVTEILAGGPVMLTYFDTHSKQPVKWTISKQQIADWLTIGLNQDNQPTFAVSDEALNKFITTSVKPTVDVRPSDAVFKLNASSTRAIQFVGGRPGVTVDATSTQAGVQLLFSQRLAGKVATSTPLIIAKVDPKVRTEDTNNLGIKEILGVGYSNFSNSPKNRILNIRNAVTNKLNGILIPPEVEFSLVNTLKPFTLESGYLPELVIKGDRITPEVAGGLCQVGTTMFRTVMNSGLPVTARTNHGLVVSYYNDPANGNPGTDATIYEPWPDFKFKNDTGHNILIETEMNTKTGALVFTMWGTNDGRKGYYTPPKVLSRTPAGVAKTIETDDLAPGKKECQGAHPGAVAAFDYIRELASGQKEVKTYTSTYRAVPATCYVGRDPNKPVCAEGDVACITTTPTPSPITEPPTNPAAPLPPAPLNE